MEAVPAKKHYDNHLAAYYSWMAGDFASQRNSFMEFCTTHGIAAGTRRQAIDLGAGHGVQSAVLAALGFNVLAVDFNEQLLTELKQNCTGLSVQVLLEDIRNIRAFTSTAELIVCCGDTISHLDSWEEIHQLLRDAFDVLLPSGKVLLSFRDYAQPQHAGRNIIPVQQDEHRIFTCILDFLPEKVCVTDLVYERFVHGWEMNVSAYHKVRVTNASMMEALGKAGFEVVSHQQVSGMHWVIGKRTT